MCGWEAFCNMREVIHGAPQQMMDNIIAPVKEASQGEMRAYILRQS